MTHQDIVNIIEDFAPPSLQESYDNSGWQFGNPEVECTGVLIALDLTEAVMDEAKEQGCNLIITHHPVIFSGLKQLIGKNTVQRLIISGIQSGISVYSCHTNLDNLKLGVNKKIANKLGLEQTHILAPNDSRLLKLSVFVPYEAEEKVREAIFGAGAGNIGNYSECSFTTKGVGTFTPGEESNPYSGTPKGERYYADELKIEFLVPYHLKRRVYQAMIDAHPYEEVAHEWYLIDNQNQDIGAGMCGLLPREYELGELLDLVKNNMNTEVIRYTPMPQEKKFRKIAVCGGSGSFLLNEAKRQGCDALITADFKYHQFFEAEGAIMIMDIGHFESEQFTSEIFYDIIKDKIPNFAVRISKINTNPIKYHY